MVDVLYGRADEFLVAKRAQVQVIGKVLAKSLNKRLIVRSGVELFGAEQFLVAKLPRPLQHLNMEHLHEVTGDVL